MHGKDISSYYEEIRSYFLRRSFTADIASDLTQETFLRALTYEKFNDHSQKKPLLFTIATNLAIDFVRKRRLSMSDLQEAVELESRLPNPLELAEVRERTSKIDEAISALSPRCRQAFILCKAFGFTHAKIAEEMNISERTVSKHLETALKSIRAHVKKFSI